MTAPMLVTHWINWQYHASTCDPVRLGSGNKLLHNVVGASLASSRATAATCGSAYLASRCTMDSAGCMSRCA